MMLKHRVQVTWPRDPLCCDNVPTSTKASISRNDSNLQTSFQSHPKASFTVDCFMTNIHLESKPKWLLATKCGASTIRSAVNISAWLRL
mmetsp:Transcript_21546/g.45254  ORF Transcript_21546/g.45254 Transcript_21546/m.45254 type:complete len:89 (-) Transcript_21546:250-516(-)